MKTFRNLRGYSRNGLLQGDICLILFRHVKTQRACRLFLDWLKSKNGEASRFEIVAFGRALQDGKVLDVLQDGAISEGFRYPMSSFYATVLNTLLKFGFMNKSPRYGKGLVYVTVFQPIPQNPPLLNTWWGFSYMVAERWNKEL